MKQNSPEVSVLHCGPGGRGWGGGGRERQPLEATIKPVHGLVTVLSLPHACLATGLFEDLYRGSEIIHNQLEELIQRKWEGSVERFFADAKSVGCTRTAVDQYADGLCGAIIGWDSSHEYSHYPGNSKLRYCHELIPTVALLSRRVGNIFIAARPPDYSWEALFDSAFEIDDDTIPALPGTAAPWSRFRWANY